MSKNKHTTQPAEPEIIEELIEAVNLLKPYIDVFEAIKRVSILFGCKIYLERHEKYSEKWEAIRSLNPKDFLEEINTIFSNRLDKYLSFLKYADNIPEQLFHDIIKIISGVNVSEDNLEKIRNSIRATLFWRRKSRKKIFLTEKQYKSHAFEKLSEAFEIFFYNEYIDAPPEDIEISIVENLNEAVNLLKPHIDVFEAIKRVLILFITYNLYIGKSKKQEDICSLNPKEFLKEIYKIFSGKEVEDSSFLKYADDVPKQVFQDIIRLVSEGDAHKYYFFAVRDGILNIFLSPQNIRDKIFMKKAPQTPHSLRKLIYKIAFYEYQSVEDADKDSFADIFLGLDETFSHKFIYQQSLRNIIGSFRCSDDEREFLYQIAFFKNHYILTDSIYLFLNQPVVYCNPMDSPYFDPEDKSPEYHEDFFSKTIYNHLDSYGYSMITLIPLKSLSRQGKIKDLLKSLIEKDMCLSIIELPENILLPNTSMAVALLKIRKYPPGKVSFARTSYNINKNGEIEIQQSDIQALRNRLERFKSDWKYFAVVGVDDIKGNNYDLSPSLYLDYLEKEINKLTAEGKGKPLKELAVIGGDKYTEEERNTPYIDYKNLNSNKQELFLNPELTLLRTKKSDLRFVTKKSILVSMRTEDLKPTIYDPEVFSKMCNLSPKNARLSLAADLICILFASKLPPVLSFDKKVTAIIPDEKIVDIEYLYFQLYNPVVIRQVESKLYVSYKKPRWLTIEDLGSLIIPFEHSLETQIEIVQKEKKQLLEQNFIKHQKAMIEYRKLLKITEFKQDTDLVGHLRHNINPKLQKLRGPIKRIKQFIEKENLQDRILAKNIDGTSETIKDAFHQAEANIESIKKLLDKTKDFIERKIDRNEFEKRNIYEIFQKLIKPHYQDRQYALKIYCNVKSEIFVHPSLFCEAIDNIITNAENHAFEDNQKNQEIIFKISENDESVIIDYTNNGKKFPENMTTEDFLTIGKKSISSKGEGLGGAWIGKVIEAHNGLFEIIRDNYPVHFRITLPKAD